LSDGLVFALIKSSFNGGFKDVDVRLETSMIRVLVPLADGVEEMEAVIVVDVLRRAQFEVTVAGLKPGVVTASRGVRLVPDLCWEELGGREFDLLMIPGGMEGTRRLMGDERVLARIRAMVETGQWVGAICAGPLVLQAAGVLKGRRVTCHPGVVDQLTATARLPDRVATDGRLITSQGPGTTFEFALEAIRKVSGDALAKRVAEELLLAK
jgi:4-methyl-5(b-hydroxyethyl)-thiazole monophosphate biosynthesis